MKKETKELIDWIKKQISISGTVVTDISQPNWQEDKKKAFNFLSSLPEIENKLCFGGYIQDYNGTPCCHGDKVVYKSKVYTLQWSQPYNRFFLKTDKSVRDVWDFGRHEILKVEDNND